MANWKYTLDISNIFHSEDLTIDEKGKQIASRIERMVPSSWLNWELDDYDEEVDEIIQRFKEVTGSNDYPIAEEFDDIMDCLYDWGDQEVAPFGKWPRNAMCWIETSYSKVKTTR